MPTPSIANKHMTPQSELAKVDEKVRRRAYEGGFANPSPDDGLRTFLTVPLTFATPSLLRSTRAAQRIHIWQ